MAARACVRALEFGSEEPVPEIVRSLGRILRALLRGGKEWVQRGQKVNSGSRRRHAGSGRVKASATKPSRERRESETAGAAGAEAWARGLPGKHLAQRLNAL